MTAGFYKDVAPTALANLPEKIPWLSIVQQDGANLFLLFAQAAKPDGLSAVGAISL